MMKTYSYCVLFLGVGIGGGFINLDARLNNLVVQHCTCIKLTLGTRVETLPPYLISYSLSSVTKRLTSQRNSHGVFCQTAFGFVHNNFYCVQTQILGSLRTPRIDTVCKHRLNNLVMARSLKRVIKEDVIVVPQVIYLHTLSCHVFSYGSVAIRETQNCSHSVTPCSTIIPTYQSATKHSQVSSRDGRPVYNQAQSL